MQLFKRTVAGLVAAIILVTGFSLAATAGDQDGKDVTIFLKDVKVKTKNADGNHWDAFEGKPDLRVYMKNLTRKDAQDFSSKTYDDTFTAKYNTPALAVRSGETVEIHVYDVDIAANDLVGKTKLTITPEILKKGSQELTFNNVASLRIAFQSSKNE